MVLSYQDKDESKERQWIRAKITIDHSESGNGQTVLVLDDGGVLDLMSLASMGYRVEKVNRKERVELQKIGLL